MNKNTTTTMVTVPGNDGGRDLNVALTISVEVKNPVPKKFEKNVELKGMATTKQLEFADTLGKSKGLSESALAALTLEKFKNMPAELTKKQASDLIQLLKELPKAPGTGNDDPEEEIPV